MKKRLFTDSSTRPTEVLLRKHLGSAMGFYTKVLSTSGGYRKQWQYSRGNGWILKVDDMRKALYYLIAFDEGIEVSLTVRDSERDELLRNVSLESVHPRLEAGTKYPEGYALRFEVENDEACQAVGQFLLELMKIRASAPKSVSRKTAAKAQSPKQSPKQVAKQTPKQATTSKQAARQTANPVPGQTPVKLAETRRISVKKSS
jgi:hypothetical protein